MLPSSVYQFGQTPKSKIQLGDLVSLANPMRLQSNFEAKDLYPMNHICDIIGEVKRGSSDSWLANPRLLKHVALLTDKLKIDLSIVRSLRE